MPAIYDVCLRQSGDRLPWELKSTPRYTHFAFAECFVQLNAWSSLARVVKCLATTEHASGWTSCYSFHYTWLPCLFCACSWLNANGERMCTSCKCLHAGSEQLSCFLVFRICACSVIISSEATFTHALCSYVAPIPIFFLPNCSCSRDITMLTRLRRRAGTLNEAFQAC